MTDVPEADLKLRDLLNENARLGREPIVLSVGFLDHEYVLDRLRYLGVPEVAYRLVVAESERPLMERGLSPAALGVLAFASNLAAESTVRTPRADRVVAEADAMLARYRHNDPDVAARIRAERQAKRAPAEWNPEADDAVDPA